MGDDLASGGHVGWVGAVGSEWMHLHDTPGGRRWKDGGGQTAEMRRQQEQTFSNKYLKFSRFPSRPLPPGNSLIDVLLASANE